MAEHDKILRMPAIISYTGLSRSTIYRKIKEGTFPAQVRISDHCSGWRASTIERWIKDPETFRNEEDPGPVPGATSRMVPKRPPPRLS